MHFHEDEKKEYVFLPLIAAWVIMVIIISIGIYLFN